MREKVLGFFQSPICQQFRIVRRIERECRWSGINVESFDEQAAFVVGGEVHRAHEFGGSPARHQSIRGVQQEVCGFLVVDAFEQAEEADVFGMEFVVGTVFGSGRSGRPVRG